MTEVPSEELTDADIKAFLETAPLYSWRVFLKPKTVRYSLWINEIDAYCESCDQSRPFQDLRPRGSGGASPTPTLKTGTSYFTFSCVSCRKEHREYLVEQVLDERTIRFQKYGELPRARIGRNRMLQRFLSEDLENY